MSDCFAGLALPLEEPVRLELIRAGTNESRLENPQWMRHPYSVVGYVRRGPFEIEVEGEPAYRAQKGGAYLVPADTPFRTRAVGPGVGEYVWSHVNFHLAGGMELSGLLRLSRCIPAGPDGGKTIERVNEAFARMLAGRAGPEVVVSAAGSAVASDAQLPPGSLIEAVHEQRLGMEMLELLLAHARPTAAASAVLSAHSRLRPVFEYVRAHLAEPITRADLARAASLSESRLHVVFREAMGVAPLVYVTQLRLRQAQAILMHSDLPIAQIGQACGYPDAFHFSRQFKQHLGLSPSDYRQRQRSRGPLGL